MRAHRARSLPYSPVHLPRAAFILGVAAMAPLSPAEAAPKFHTLYTFSGGSDGGAPTAAVTLGKSGVLYGTATSGGFSSSYCGDGNGTCGVVFQLTPPAISGGNWVQTVLYSFTGGADGGNPAAPLLIGKDGALYGTAADGGNTGSQCSLFYDGCGTVFKLTPPAATGGAWTQTTLYNFQGGSDGFYSTAGLVTDKSGALYGTTSFGGGPAECGTVFKLTPPVSGTNWTETILHAFQGRKDGCTPYYAGVIRDKNGAFYGTTVSGSNSKPYGFGTVFKLAPPAKSDSWTLTTLYRFTGGEDGGSPMAGVVADEFGKLYGTTESGGSSACGGGCGTVFKLSPQDFLGKAWTETVLHAFQFSDGDLPWAGVVIGEHGALFGTTVFGGTIGDGTAFKLIPPHTSKGAWSETILHSFTGGADGASPLGAGLRFGPDGAIFGTSTVGNTQSPFGTVFELGSP